MRKHACREVRSTCLAMVATDAKAAARRPFEFRTIKQRERHGYQATRVRKEISVVPIIVPSECVTYLSVERPAVNYFNSAYITYIKLISKRYGRSNPVYYTSLLFDARVYFGNNVTIDFYFFEFLSNRYQRSFVEMHFKLCDMVHKDPFFGAPMRRGGLEKPCPWSPGKYHLYNMTVPSQAIPRGFPFRKGRIFANLSFTFPKGKIPYTGARLAWLQIDMEVRQADVKKIGVKL
ncbi:uncharacterized protein LOC126366464 [Pectinophora gossypiella]|uniref:uncharacterized protein LOC126366464 n=1 Tax=Pectinophora gossypiella TaxID=13191 RepID=UPI00214EBE40|nr:uncharacterized protein LOC126366464 [Pectinophora gossypiella]